MQALEFGWVDLGQRTVISPQCQLAAYDAIALYDQVVQTRTFAHRGDGRRSHWRLPGVVAVLVVVAAIGGLGVATGWFRSSSSPPALADPTTRRTLTGLTAENLRVAAEMSVAYLSNLIVGHSELVGATIVGTFPVFDEDTTSPVGAMVRVGFPAPVPTVTMTLVRSHNGTAEPIESVITNLHGLDVIMMFATHDVVTVGVTPQEADGADPVGATRVAAVDPEQHRGSDFADND